MTVESANSPARRTVLAGVGLAGAAAVLSACSTDSPGGVAAPGPTPTDNSGGTPGAPATSADGGGAAGSTAGQTAGTGGTVLGASSDVPVGGGKVFTDAKVVVTQPTAGDFKAFSAVCTHAGCIVGSVADGVINCPCHGSQYHITDGSVARGPAPSPLAAKTVAVSGGNISLS